MTIEQRKDKLISWVAGLDNEAMLCMLEELKKDSKSGLPKQILKLLDESNSVGPSELTEHTSSRNLLKR